MVINEKILQLSQKIANVIIYLVLHLFS